MINYFIERFRRFSDLQLRAASVHPHVVGEGGSEESTRRLPVRQVEVDHQPGRRGR